MELLDLVKQNLGDYWTHSLLIIGFFFMLARRFPNKWNIFLTLLRAGNKKSLPVETTDEKLIDKSPAKSAFILATNGAAKKMVEDLAVVKDASRRHENLIAQCSRNINNAAKEIGEIKGMLAHFTTGPVVKVKKTTRSSAKSSKSKGKGKGK